MRPEHTMHFSLQLDTQFTQLRHKAECIPNTS